MKFKKTFAILIILILSILQSTALDYIKIFRVKPDVLLVSVIFFSLYFRQANFGLLAGFLSGLLEDILSNSLIGINASLFGLSGLLLGIHSNKIYKDSPLAQLIISFIATLSILSLSYSLSSLITKSNYFFVESFRFVILPVSLYTALISPAIFFILSKIFGKPPKSRRN